MRNVRCVVAIAVSVLLVGAMAGPAPAISVDLAKKCRDLALKAHPYKLAGTKGGGTAAAERDYFNQCVARGGDMPNETSSGDQAKDQNNKDQPSEDQPPEAPQGQTNGPPAAAPPK